jgi:hypothetical protein
VPGDPRRRERRLIIVLAVVLTVLRSATLVFFEGAHFDSDQALIGLMAKHLVEGRAFPVFTYGQAYMVGLEAWMAAPFFVIGGATVAMLKLPLLLVNVAVSVVLVLTLERASGLRPAVAIVPALFFILAPLGTTTLFLEASGGNVEPFLYVLILWAVRHRPLAFGAVLALGVLQREFTAYGLGAIALLSVADRSLFRPANWRPMAFAAVAFAAVWQGIYLLKQFSSIDGPGTAVDWSVPEASANVGAVLNHFCFEAGQLASGIYTLGTTHLASMFGAETRSLMDFGINSRLTQGVDWLWPILGTTFALALGRVIWLAVRQRVRPWEPPLAFTTYLALIGLQALAVYALFRCGVVSVGTLRYSLFGIFGGVGVMAAYLRLEPIRRLRHLAIAVTLLFAAVSATDHATLARQYIFDPPPNPRRVLADHLVERGVRYASGDFWDAYITSFYSEEQVIVASTTVSFIDEYQRLVNEHDDEAVRVLQEPCEGGTRLFDRLYVCPPEGGRESTGSEERPTGDRP